LIDVDLGLYIPSDINSGVSPFVTIGWASFFMTEAPEDPMTRTDENGNWIPPMKVMVSPGLAAGVGVSGLAFLSQTRTFEEFKGYSMNLSGSLLIVSGGESRNDANQRTKSVGFGWTHGLPISAAMYGSRTYGFTIPMLGPKLFQR
jgi:hypothetical protein